MRIRTREYPAGACLVALAAALPGCGDGSDSFDRQAVSGSVTLDGKPITGDILFIPMGNGASAGGGIADGTYSIGRAAGPSPGSYRVEVVSIQPTGRTIPDRDGPPGSTAEEKANVVPARYNAKSELTAEVKKGVPNTFIFPLTSTPDPHAKRLR
jgi:hypothetical protein